MNYQLMLLRIGLFLIFGLSMAIILYGTAFLKEKNKKRLFANCFIGPAICISFGYGYGGESLARGSIVFGFFSLLITMYLVERSKKNSKNFKAIDTLILIVSILSAATVIRVSTLYIAPNIYFGINIVTVTIAFIMAYKHSNDKGNEISFLRGLMLLLFGVSALFFAGNGYGLFFVMAFLSVSLYNMYGYFHEGNYRKIIAKIYEAERLKASIEKDLNYEVKKRMFEIEKSNERLLEISKTDALTKAYNKATILNIIDKHCSSKNAKKFSVIMFDIDYFKQVNDKLGHMEGDICLKTLSNIVFRNMRSIDYFGRYGGDEFIVVLPMLGLSEAMHVAERFRSRIAETKNPNLTISIGVSCFPEDGTNTKEILAVADEGLYLSKGKGRNAVFHRNMC